MDASLRFPPLRPVEAKAELTFLLHQSPQHYGIKRTRWRLQDLKRTVTWLAQKSEAAISHLLKRFRLGQKQVLRFMRSPDPNYHVKWQAILQAKLHARAHPQEVELLFADELTSYRSPTTAPVYHEQGQRQPRVYQHPDPNTQTRLLGALNSMTGQLVYLQRSTVGAKALVNFAAQLRQAYPDAKTLYLVLDNWPTHKLPEVLAAFAQPQISLLFLPTYACWLNPIEKLWRYLKQEVLHSHQLASQLAQLRCQVTDFLDQFAYGSDTLLRFVGLLLD